MEKTLGKAHEMVFGSAIEAYPSTALTDGRIYGHFHNMTTLVYGPTAENIHAYDERVNLESVRKITQAVALFIADWCDLEEA
jgi:acetylornithine deacetylase